MTYLLRLTIDSGITSVTVAATDGAEFPATESGLATFDYPLASITYTLASGYKFSSITSDVSTITFNTSGNPILITDTTGTEDERSITITTESTTYKKITYDGKKVQVDSAIRDGVGNTISTYYLPASKCTYQEEAPSAAIQDGGVHIVFLSEEPETKYDGYIYLISE